MVVRRRCHGYAEQVLIIVDRFDHRDKKEKELRIFVRSFAGLEKVGARVRRDRPVVVLSGAVDSRERLFVEQADHSVLTRDLLHHFHRELVVIAGYVRCREYGGKLMLRGCNLVVLGLCENSELPKLFVELTHEGGDLRLDRTEIVIVKLLSLRAARAEESASGVNEIAALVEHILRDEEIFLLGSDRGLDVRDGFVTEKAEDTHRLTVQRLHRAQKRCLFVECFAAV